MLKALWGLGGAATTEPDPRLAGLIGPSSTLTAQETHELAAKYKKETEDYSKNVEAMMGKLVKESTEMKRRVLNAETELGSWKAGRAEDQKEIAKLKKELGTLKGDGVSLIEGSGKRRLADSLR